MRVRAGEGPLLLMWRPIVFLCACDTCRSRWAAGKRSRYALVTVCRRLCSADCVPHTVCSVHCAPLGTAHFAPRALHCAPDSLRPVGGRRDALCSLLYALCSVLYASHWIIANQVTGRRMWPECGPNSRVQRRFVAQWNRRGQCKGHNAPDQPDEITQPEREGEIMMADEDDDWHNDPQASDSARGPTWRSFGAAFSLDASGPPHTVSMRPVCVLCARAPPHAAPLGAPPLEARGLRLEALHETVCRPRLLARA